MVESAAIKLLYAIFDVGTLQMSLGSVISKPDRMLKETRVDNSCTSSVTNISPHAHAILSYLSYRQEQAFNA